MQPNEATAGTEFPSASARNARIGLVLVIVTAAIATALVLATILPGGPRADAQHADATAAEVAASIRTALGSATGIAAQLAADPAVVAILAKPGTKQPPAPPPALVDAASRLRGSAPQILLVDAARAVRLAFAPPGGQPVGNGAILVAAGKGSAVTPVVIDAQGDHRVGVVAAVPTGLGKGGSVLVSVSLEAVLRGATAAAGPGSALELLDAKGGRIARADAPPAAGNGTDPSEATVTATANRALDGLPAGFPAWSLVVRMPVLTTGGPREPLPILLGIAGILGVVGVTGAYLALRPAGRLASTSEELQRKYAEVAEQAYIDVMTGLGNQRAFQIECDRHLDLVRRGRLPLTLVIVDLDDFKRINDTDGHKVGDELLAAFARIIEGCIRRSDRAFRIGGDEFAILMPGTNVDGAEIVTRRLLASALEPPVGSAAGRRVISFSGGIAEATPQTDRVELFSQADAAMYWSKRHGRTVVSIFDPDKHPLPSRVSADLTSAVARVIEQRSVRAVFQPIVELATGRVIGYEGLVRPTAHPFVDAGTLFAAAEGSGRTAELDYVCLETVAAAAISIPADRYVAINLSPRTLEAPEF
ncbi:MAG: diguanylate cyclase, partial [Chloroflexota bacterium]|nr:diguanylate cyclase [Chloroflexota bacterium]